MKHFFDTYALIEIIKGSDSYNMFKDEALVTSSLNLGELYYKLCVDFDKRVADFWYKRLKDMIIEVSTEHVIKGMLFKLSNKRLSFVDCVSYALAQDYGFVFVTGDKGFKGIANVEFVK